VAGKKGGGALPILDFTMSENFQDTKFGLGAEIIHFGRILRKN